MTLDGQDNTDNLTVQTLYVFILIIYIHVHC